MRKEIVQPLQPLPCNQRTEGVAEAASARRRWINSPGPNPKAAEAAVQYFRKDRRDTCIMTIARIPSEH